LSNNDSWVADFPDGNFAMIIDNKSDLRFAMPAPVREQPRPVVEAILSDPRHHPQSNFDSAMKIRLTTATYAGACGLDIVMRASVVYRSALL